jgi:hypothetical protein
LLPTGNSCEATCTGQKHNVLVFFSFSLLAGQQYISKLTSVARVFNLCPVYASYILSPDTLRADLEFVKSSGGLFFFPFLSLVLNAQLQPFFFSSIFSFLGVETLSQSLRTQKTV